MLQTRLPIEGPLDLPATFGAMLSKGVGRFRREPGVMWWVTRPPEGPATLRVEVGRGEVTASAWGEGAEVVLKALPDLLGLHDDPSEFDPPPGPVRELHRRKQGLRLGRTGRVFEAVLPTILGQRVTTMEAERSYRSIVRSHGSPAPGPIEGWVPPAAETLAALSYADLHPLGVERGRAARIIEAARRARRLEEITAMSFADAHARLTAVRGIGEWTAAQVLGSAMGDPDAVPVGDYHIPDMVGWALAGEPRADDDRMLELLEPYRGHRRRVILLLKQAGVHAPRYGPKAAPRDFRAS